MTDFRVILLALASVACLALMCLAIDDTLNSRSKSDVFAGCLYVVFFALFSVLIAFKGVEQYKQNEDYYHGL